MSEPQTISRQSLVVPPRRSNVPVMIGAVACGLVGFGLVWALGIGREPADSREVSVRNDAQPAGSPADQAGNDAPGRFPADDEAIREMPAPDRWQPRGTTTAAEAAGGQVRPTSLETPPPASIDFGEARPLSRFSGAAVRPAEATVDVDEPQATASVPAAAPFATDADVPPPMREPVAVPDSAPATEAGASAAESSIDAVVAPRQEDAGDLPAAVAADDASAASRAAVVPPPGPPAPVPSPATAPAVTDHPPARPAVTEFPVSPRGVQGATAA